MIATQPLQLLPKSEQRVNEGVVKPEDWVKGSSFSGGEVAEEVIVKVVVRGGDLVRELLKLLFVQGQLNLSQ